MDIGCTDKEGQCTCKDGYAGLKCDTCAGGWFMVNGKCHGKFPLFMYIILLPLKKRQTIILYQRDVQFRTLHLLDMIS